MSKEQKVITKSELMKIRALEAEKLVNRIDDFFEYRYRSHTIESVRAVVLGEIQEYSSRVSKSVFSFMSDET